MFLINNVKFYSISININSGNIRNEYFWCDNNDICMAKLCTAVT